MSRELTRYFLRVEQYHCLENSGITSLFESLEREREGIYYDQQWEKYQKWLQENYRTPLRDSKGMMVIQIGTNLDNSPILRLIRRNMIEK